MYSPVTEGETFTLTGRLRVSTGPLGTLTGASAVLVFAPVSGESSNSRFQATGTVQITDPTLDIYTFTPSGTDLTKLKAGDWLLQAVLTLSGGPIRYSRPVPLRVEAAL